MLRCTCGHEEDGKELRKCPNCEKGFLRLYHRCPVCFRYFKNGELEQHLQKDHYKQGLVYVVCETDTDAGLFGLAIYRHVDDAIAYLRPIINGYRKLYKRFNWHTSIKYSLDDANDTIPDNAVRDNLLSGNIVRVPGFGYTIRPERIL